MGDQEYANYVKLLLVNELKRRKLTYEDLARLMQQRSGSRHEVKTIANKIGRGRFSAIFLVEALLAIGCDEIRLDKAPE